MSSLVDTISFSLLELRGFLVNQLAQPELFSLVVQSIVFEGKEHTSGRYNFHFGSSNRSQKLGFQRLLHSDAFAWIYGSSAPPSPTKNKHSFQQVERIVRHIGVKNVPEIRRSHGFQAKQVLLFRPCDRLHPSSDRRPAPPGPLWEACRSPRRSSSAGGSPLGSPRRTVRSALSRSAVRSEGSRTCRGTAAAVFVPSPASAAARRRCSPQTTCRSPRCSTPAAGSAPERGTSESPRAASADAPCWDAPRERPCSQRPSAEKTSPTATFVSFSSLYCWFI